MKKYLFIGLFIGVWSCVDQSDPGLEVEFISVGDNGTLRHNSGILVRFNQPLSKIDFNASSIDSSFVTGSVLDDTQNEQATTFNPSIFKINNSDFITIDGESQTFYYDSKTNECLLITISTVFFPDGVGEGLDFPPGNDVTKNISILNNDYSVLFQGGNETVVFPNPKYFTTIINDYISVRNDEQKIIKTHLYDSDFSNLIRTNSNDFSNRFGQIYVQNNEAQYLENGFYGFEVEYDNTSIFPATPNLRGYFIYLSPN